MRKHIRKMMKYLAEREKSKTSYRVRNLWDRLQIKRRGKKYRDVHKVIGTHKRKIWKSRIENI